MATETGIIDIALTHMSVAGSGRRADDIRRELVGHLPSILRTTGEMRVWRAFLKQVNLPAAAPDNVAPARYPQDEAYVLIDMPADLVRIVAIQNPDLISRQNPDGMARDARPQAGRKIRVRARTAPYVLSYTTHLIVEEMSETLAHYVALSLAVFVIGLTEHKDDDFYKVIIGKRQAAETAAIEQDRDRNPASPRLWTSPEIRTAAEETRFAGGFRGVGDFPYGYDCGPAKPADPPDRANLDRFGIPRGQ